MTHKTLGKILAVASVALAASAMAQEVTQARVVSVTPIERMFSSYELTEPICTTVTVPVERRIPVYREVVEQGNPALGMILGAAIGHHVFRGDGAGAGVAGAFLGAAVGNTVTSGSRRVYVEYQTEVRYEDRTSCERRSEFVTRPVIDGYNVTYIFQGRQRTVFMKTHPGDYVRITTTYSVAP